MSEQQHTPTPWTLKFGRISPEAEIFGFALMSDSKDHSICGNGIYEATPLIVSEEYRNIPDFPRLQTAKEVEANARFILRAVNSHEALMDALESIANCKNDNGCDTCKSVAREALTQAKGT